MPIALTDIAFRLSGGPGNTSELASLGGAMSTVAGGIITSGAANNLWGDVTGDQSAAGLVDYRAFYVQNDHSTLTWQNVMLWIDALTSSPDTEFDVGLAIEPVGTPIVQVLFTETDAPTGVVFSRPIDKADGLLIGDIPPGSFRGIWIRRTVNAGAAAALDVGSIRAEGDTGQ